MKIALVSLDQIWENKTENLTNCDNYVVDAVKEDVDVIIFPEMTLTGFSMNIKEIGEKEDSSFTITGFKNLAKKYNIAIVFGVVLSVNEKAENRLYFIDESGEVKLNYTKIHPFSFAGEDKYYNGGNSLEIVEYKEHNIGMTICYDLRFPELYSSLSKNSDIIINIANWPAKRVDHWNTLLKARAIENQIFIIGVNRTGKDGNGLEYVECSNIFDPNGDNVEFKANDKMKIYNIDRNWIKEFKSKFNTTNDRKVKLYKEVL